MTPAARVAAAISILDEIIAGTATEAALLHWTRGSRFAGSKDRAAIRDLVFNARRKWSSCQFIGGGVSGRRIMLGLLHQQDIDLNVLFRGDKYAPACLSDEEKAHLDEDQTLPPHTTADMQPWVWARLSDQYAEAAMPIAEALRERAPVFIRVNAGKATKDAAILQLSQQGIEARATPICQSALEVTAGARKIRTSDAYLNGLIELQDAASQALIEALPLQVGMQVLDFCAGGGGKSLAVAAVGANVTAYDIKAERMVDLPARSRRAGVHIDTLDRLPRSLEAFDLVLCDAPCSGSGSWRRSPDGKWSLNQARLGQLKAAQLDVLKTAQNYVRPDGCLAYATCSVLSEENENTLDEFIRTSPEWSISNVRKWTPLDGADGFFLATLIRR